MAPYKEPFMLTAVGFISFSLPLSTHYSLVRPTPAQPYVTFLRLFFFLHFKHPSKMQSPTVDFSPILDYLNYSSADPSYPAPSSYNPSSFNFSSADLSYPAPSSFNPSSYDTSSFNPSFLAPTSLDPTSLNLPTADPLSLDLSAFYGIPSFNPDCNASASNPSFSNPTFSASSFPDATSSTLPSSATVSANNNNPRKRSSTSSATDNEGSERASPRPRISAPSNNQNRNHGREFKCTRCPKSFDRQFKLK